MNDLWLYIIPLVAVVLIGFLAGRKQRFSAFCKELGEALIETSKYVNLEKPTEEDTLRFKKEWKEALEAGGSLIKKIIAVAEQRK